MIPKPPPREGSLGFIYIPPYRVQGTSIAGEVTTKAYIDMQKVVRDVINDVGYTEASMGISADHCAVLVALHGQSPDIAMGVDSDAAKGKELQRVENAGLYWHFVDLVWIFLFPLLYIAK